MGEGVCGKERPEGVSTEREREDRLTGVRDKMGGICSLSGAVIEEGASDGWPRGPVWGNSTIRCGIGIRKAMLTA